MECAIALEQQARSIVVTKYLVAYARIQSDKDSEITLQGVYFGGIGDTPEEAKRIAREVVNTVKGGTILPKVLSLENSTFMDAMIEATERFEQVAAYMIDVDNTIKRTYRR